MKLTCTICGHQDYDLVPHIEAKHGGDSGLRTYIQEHGGDISCVIGTEEDAPVASSPAEKKVIMKIADVEIAAKATPSKTHAAFIPKINEAYSFQACTTDVVHDINERKPILLIGHTGTGKTSMIEQIAARIKQPSIRVNLNQQTTVSDFVGYWGVVAGETVWTDGALPWAMKTGAWIIVDELDYGEPAILSVLNSVLERGGRLMLKEKGNEIVEPHADFRIFGTGNAIGQMAEFRHLYQGTNLLNEAFLDRWKVYKVDYLPEATEAKVLAATVMGVSEPLAKHLVKVATAVRAAFTKEEISCTFSTRRLVEWAEMVVRHRKSGEASVITAAESTIFSKISREDCVVVKGLIQRLIDQAKSVR